MVMHPFSMHDHDSSLHVLVWRYLGCQIHIAKTNKQTNKTSVLFTKDILHFRVSFFSFIKTIAVLIYSFVQVGIYYIAITVVYFTPVLKVDNLHLETCLSQTYHLPQLHKRRHWLISSLTQKSQLSTNLWMYCDNQSQISNIILSL